jgi:GNAT superfamily N-acetyltransferase
MAAPASEPLSEKPNTVTIEIRRAKPEDSAEIAKLSGQLGYEATAAQVARRLEEACGSGEYDVLVAQTPVGEIVGWIGVYIYRTVTSPPRVEISGLVVDEKHRSQEIGATLLESADDWAVAKGLHSIGLHCNTIRERAHEFYLRHGYRLEKTQKLFRKALP